MTTTFAKPRLKYLIFHLQAIKIQSSHPIINHMIIRKATTFEKYLFIKLSVFNHRADCYLHKTHDLFVIRKGERTKKLFNLKKQTIAFLGPSLLERFTFFFVRRTCVLIMTFIICYTYLLY